MKLLDERCEMCLEVLDVINEKKFNAVKHKALMLAHKPNCKQWNEKVAKVLKI